MSDQPAARKKAVLYLRVSTPSQVNTDFDPEGISIPAQRSSCARKAEQLGIDIVGEYIEPGRSGTTMRSRPVFQEMMERLRERDVDHVIVYKLSRLNRNWEESAQVIMALRKVKVELLSATENIDATPVGRLTLGILSAINEFRSAEDGEDIRYKMGEKAKKGGVIGKARIGYLNVREPFEGRLVATLAIDPARAPLVRQAFELYSTGDYTLDALQQALADLGLRAKATKRWPAQPVSRSQLHRILQDPTYTGVIVYKDTLYPGRHEALIDGALFERVQEVLEFRSRRGSRDRVHEHHLKGMLFCGRCQAKGRESRLILTEAQGRAGEFYQYFLCRGRQESVCDLPYLRVEHVEEAVAEEYSRLDLGANFAKQVEGSVTDTLKDEQATSRLVRDSYATELQRLQAAEERLIDLAADGSLPMAKIRTRITQNQQAQVRLRDELVTADDRIEAGARALRHALKLLDRPERLYRRCDDHARRLLTQTFYERLWIDDGDVVSVALAAPFDELKAAEQSWDIADLAAMLTTPGKQKSPSKARALPGTSTDLLEAIRLDGGSSKPVMVEVAGIEPASNGTACRASPGAAPCGLLGPSVVGSNCAAGPSCCSMSHPGPQPARSVSLLSTRPSRPETLRGPRLHWVLSSESELSAVGTCVFRRGD